MFSQVAYGEQYGDAIRFGDARKAERAGFRTGTRHILPSPPQRPTY